MNGKFYVCSKFSDVVFYVTVRYVRINGTLRYVAIPYVMLREGGKQVHKSLLFEALSSCFVHMTKSQFPSKDGRYKPSKPCAHKSRIFGMYFYFIESSKVIYF